MSKFITGTELEDVVYDIIWEAERTLLIVSPYIKLDDYFKGLFKKHVDTYKLHILLIFGKNEKNIHKSLSNEDLGYFKQFPNVSIIYVPDLHAKYYGNERKGVITSINLYDYSFKNNIEFGVYSEQNLLSKFSSSADVEAWQHCMDIAEDYNVVFIRRPAFRPKKGIISIGKEYIKSETLYDLTESFHGTGKAASIPEKRLSNFPDTIDLDSDTKERPERVWEDEIGTKKEKVSYVQHTSNSNPAKITGYCIRTGVEIQFNPERPLSNEAYKKWNQFQDINYPEAFCHFSGDQSFGKTSFARPILHKYWKAAMKR